MDSKRYVPYSYEIKIAHSKGNVTTLDGFEVILDLHELIPLDTKDALVEVNKRIMTNALSRVKFTQFPKKRVSKHLTNLEGYLNHACKYILYGSGAMIELYETWYSKSRGTVDYAFYEELDDPAKNIDFFYTPAYFIEGDSITEHLELASSHHAFTYIDRKTYLALYKKLRRNLSSNKKKDAPEELVCPKCGKSDSLECGGDIEPNSKAVYHIDLDNASCGNCNISRELELIPKSKFNAQN